MISTTDKILFVFFSLILMCSMATIVLVVKHKAIKLVNKKETLEDFRKWYHCCRFCKYMSTSGAHNLNAKDQYVHSCYCLHPEAISTFQKIDTVDEYFFCGKWESSESFNTELFKYHSEKCLESPLRAVKKQKHQ